MTEEKPRKKLTLKRKPKPKVEEVSPTEIDSEPVAEFVRGRKRVIKMQSAAQKKAIKDSLLSPAERQSRELKRILAETYSVWRRRRPLALGVDQAIAGFVESKEVEVSKRAIKKLLHRHTHHKSYLQNVSRGGMRYQLDGTATTEITAEERDHAKRALESLDD